MFSWKKKPKSDVKSQMGSPRLSFCPNVRPVTLDFADKVIELEMQLSKSGNLDILRQLIELYTQAIEYYDSIRDPKAQYYHQRMQNLLVKKDVEQVMKSPQLSFESPKFSSNYGPTPRKINFDQPEKAENPTEELSALKKVQTLPQQRVAEKIMTNHSNVSKKTSQMIQENLKNQLSSLNSKLESRKDWRKRNLSAEPSPTKEPVSRKSIDYSLGIPSRSLFRKSNTIKQLEGDAGGGIAKKPNSEQFEQELVKMMEHFILDKLDRSNKIRHLYSEQINEIRRYGSTGSVDEVIAEMTRSMESELRILSETLEVKRKEDIISLKNKYFV